jgi:hypothetical protein
MRPVSRGAVVTSRAIVLAIGITVVYAASVGVALLLAMALDRFGAVSFGSGETAVDLISREELAAAVPRLIAVVLPALVCSALIGLMVSSAWNDPASCTICALLLVLLPWVVENVFGTPAPWAFTQGATLGSTVLSELAEGVTTRLGVVSETGRLLRTSALPLAVGAGVVAAGAASFSLRDFKG